jgi:O-antigen/teichoic acid export membrane protein
MSSGLKMLERVLRTCGVPFEARFVGEAGWVVLGQVGTVLGSLVGLKILTQVLPKEIYGQVNLITVAMILPGWLLFAPFLQAAVRMYASSREEGELPSLLRTSLSVYAAVSVLVAVGGTVLVSAGFLVRTGISQTGILIAFLVFLADTWLLLGVGLSGAARLRVRVASLSIMIAWTRPLCAVSFVVAFGPSVVHVMAGYLLAPVLVLPIALRPVLVGIRQQEGKWIQRDILRKMIVYGAPFAIWSTLSWTQNYVDRYMLQMNLGSAVVGPYVVAYQVAGLPFSLGLAFLVQFINPIVFERAGAGTEMARLASAQAIVRSSVRLFCSLGIPVLVIYEAAGVSVITLLTSGEYAVPNGVLTILGAGALAQCAAQILMTSILAHNQPKLLIGAFLIPGILSAPLSWSLVRLGGVWGAAISNAVTSFVFLASVYWIVRALVPRTTGYLRDVRSIADGAARN